MRYVIRIFACVLLLLVGFTHAQQYTTVVLEGSNYLSNVSSKDTLKGADTLLLRVGWVPVNGWEAFVAFEGITGESKDTAKVVTDVWCYGPSGQYLFTGTSTDTLTRSGGVVRIPMNNIAGFSYTIAVRNITGANTKVVINRAYLGRRK